MFRIYLGSGWVAAVRYGGSMWMHGVGMHCGMGGGLFGGLRREGIERRRSWWNDVRICVWWFKNWWILYQCSNDIYFFCRFLPSEFPQIQYDCSVNFLSIFLIAFILIKVTENVVCQHLQHVRNHGILFLSSYLPTSPLTWIIQPIWVLLIFTYINWFRQIHQKFVGIYSATIYQIAAPRNCANRFPCGMQCSNLQLSADSIDALYSLISCDRCLLSQRYPSYGFRVQLACVTVPCIEMICSIRIQLIDTATSLISYITIHSDKLARKNNSSRTTA